MPRASRTRGEKRPPRSIGPGRAGVSRSRYKTQSKYCFAVCRIVVGPTALRRRQVRSTRWRRSWKEVRSFRPQKLATDLFVNAVYLFASRAVATFFTYHRFQLVQRMFILAD